MGSQNFSPWPFGLHPEYLEARVMDLSGSQHYPYSSSSNHHQHRYVNEWHKPPPTVAAPSSLHTAAIDLSRPLAPVYHCDVPVISQTQAGNIVTADERRRQQPLDGCKSTWPPPPANCSQQSNSNNAITIYEISSDDDTVDSDDEKLLVIDEYVNLSADEMDAYADGLLETAIQEKLQPAKHDEVKQSLVQPKEASPEKKHVLHTQPLKHFSLMKNKIKETFKNSSQSLKQKLFHKVSYKKLNEQPVNKVIDVECPSEEYQVKVHSENSSALKIILAKSSKGGNKKAESQEQKTPSAAAASSSSPGLACYSRPKPKEHKYEQKNSREHNGKQTTGKSPPNESRKEGKSHDSTKKPTAAPSKNDGPEEMKKQKSSTAEMSETKRAGDANKRSVKKLLSDRELRRKFGCTKQVRVVIKRLAKDEIQRLTCRKTQIPLLKVKPQKSQSFKIDSSLKAAALMDMLLSKPPEKAAKPPQIIFAPRRVVKCHNTAAPAATPVVAKQNSSCGGKVTVNSKTFPREMIGLLERDIERTVPLERFINDKKRNDKIDWIVLDGKMQFSMHQRTTLSKEVKVKVYMPPEHSVQDVKADIEEQTAARQAAIDRIRAKRQPVKVEGANGEMVLGNPIMEEVEECCSAETKRQFAKKLNAASGLTFLQLFPTPRVSVERQQELLPNHWHSKLLSAPFLIGKYVLRGVNSLSREFEYVAAKFNKSSRQRVLAVDKVENPHLWFRYQLKKEKLELTYPHVQEVHLFHGTDKQYVDSILTYNLDWKFFGRKKGSRFGRGYYFSPLSSYAMHYTDQNTKHSIMLLFRVLTVKQCIGFEDSELPDEGYDTNISENGKVWVKFDVDDVFPDYVIHFQYEDPPEKAYLFVKHRVAIRNREAEKWKKNYWKYCIWNKFRQCHQRRPMTWRKFYMRVKKFKPKVQKPSKHSKLRCSQWRGPSQVSMTYKPKLSSAPYKNMSVWKQPKRFKQNNRVVGSYRAKKRVP
ncbi:uncharacterized protein LOC132197429 [Neocloeon triangulifer]|uniref:uncharacterized protein LOC132197429 n=1 Tax=Neocloeon triangulifer TaxID=2078957 RepID=UPI00286FAA18|nr:uncharacterized protein LOC132197429 [Neocloeon triangulifer]